MKSIVLYASKGGNTKKIADAIAAQTNSQTHKISPDTPFQAAELEGYDLVFVGTGIYGGTPNPDIEKYLKTLELKTSKQFALFITWGGAGKTEAQVKAKLQGVLEGKGHKVLSDYFTCYGGWKLLRRGRPNSEDIKAAGEWAKKVIANIEKSA